MSLTKFHMLKMTIVFGNTDNLETRREELRKVLRFYSHDHGYIVVGRLIKKGLEPIDDFDDSNVAVADACELFIHKTTEHGRH